MRTGRKRKNGHRHASGQLVRGPRVTPRQIAEGMPHRRRLGESAIDPRAESELGRLWMIGKITKAQCVAGQLYAAAVGKYRAVIDAPSALARSDLGFSCRGDLACKDCECRERKKDYDGAFEAVGKAGRAAQFVVGYVAVHDRPLPDQWLVPLQAGLTVLAQHFGLTRRSHGLITK